ncbi:MULTISPECIES: proteasome-type protease [Silvimonas]|uniref:proteasome-type protease n=1 Tax=Silvimonas TaxID=300264 RepID=UPI0024B33483|nr:MULTISPECIES: proteasome-type protease [Silvimonas]MDR3426725.1 proteasome-type protease [Silvimonas sp.]
MTYCVAMRLKDGLIFASDSRTNAGVDHIATFRKMHIFEVPGERLIVILTAGNLATTQSVVSLLQARTQQELHNLLNVPSMYDAALLVGETLREVVARDSHEGVMTQGVDFGGSFIVGGQIRGEAPRLFNVYPQANFIEASEDTPYFQIGESKYGKPILDRVIQFDTTLEHALKCMLISFDSTIRSNLSVGLPIDVLRYRNNTFSKVRPYRVEENNAWFNRTRKAWSTGLRKVFGQIPEADWFDQL